jgi:transposase
MTAPEFQQWNEDMRTRSKKMDGYEAEIIGWLRSSPDLSSAQVMDWLQERYGEIGIGESTVRSYVREIREKYLIPKVKYQRKFEAIPDPPMGQQTQVDFGEMKLEDEHKQWKTMRFIAFVLSHSRYKYVEWLDRPFTTNDVIASHERAFTYLGGMTKELVYDQDHLLVVSENHGDILFTQAFATYRAERKFQVHLCRKQDPQSKGKVENVVKYVKYSFGRGRMLVNIAKLNEACLAWLTRTGNGKMHNTTKKIPAEVYALEKQHLQPVSQQIKHETELSITRDIRKDNTIRYLSNRYSVPLGTYDSMPKEALLRFTQEGEIIIYDKPTDREIARHLLCLDKGQLIRNNNHGRDRSKGITAYIDHVAAYGPDPLVFVQYLEEIHRQKPRYIRDQLQVMEKQVKITDGVTIAKALSYCIKQGLYGAQYFTDALQYFQQNEVRVPSAEAFSQCLEPLRIEQTEQFNLKVPIREMAVYQQVLAGAAQ